VSSFGPGNGAAFSLAVGSLGLSDGSRLLGAGRVRRVGVFLPVIIASQKSFHLLKTGNLEDFKLKSNNRKNMFHQRWRKTSDKNAFEILNALLGKALFLKCALKNLLKVLSIVPKIPL
jgi:Zn-dependent metalloprotease